ncbi:hypothetical protein MGWOODY_Clf225 [hydrothermal vent metagenome]|uniref:Uncharacterized protein n=1 Tax=hydrothermal vent metagenome TaxID=652676 RepID=A0A160V8K6_9ZZZZ
MEIIAAQARRIQNKLRREVDSTLTSNQQQARLGTIQEKYCHKSEPNSGIGGDNGTEPMRPVSG